MTDLHVRAQTQRHKIYVVGLVSAVLLLIVLTLLDAPVVLVALMVSVLLANAMSALINRRWQISLHGGTMGNTTAALHLLYGVTALAIMIPLSVIVLWSRVRTGSHTFGQSLAGYLLGLFVTYLVFLIFGLI